MKGGGGIPADYIVCVVRQLIFLDVGPSPLHCDSAKPQRISQAHSPYSGLLSRRHGGSSVEGTCALQGGEVGGCGARRRPRHELLPGPARLRRACGEQPRHQALGRRRPGGRSGAVSLERGVSPGQPGVAQLWHAKEGRRHLEQAAARRPCRRARAWPARSRWARGGTPGAGR